MTSAEVQTLAAELSRRIGLRFDASAGQNQVGEFVDFGLADLDSNEGFAVRAQLGWRTLEVSFRAGSYAGQLLSDMGKANAPSKAAFLALAQQSIANGAIVSFAVNGVACNVSAPDKWPS